MRSSGVLYLIIVGGSKRTMHIYIYYYEAILRVMFILIVICYDGLIDHIIIVI